LHLNHCKVMNVDVNNFNTVSGLSETKVYL
jgi:hypothetical protein